MCSFYEFEAHIIHLSTRSTIVLSFLRFAVLLRLSLTRCLGESVTICQLSTPLQRRRNFLFKEGIKSHFNFVMVSGVQTRLLSPAALHTLLGRTYDPDVRYSREICRNSRRKCCFLQAQTSASSAHSRRESHNLPVFPFQLLNPLSTQSLRLSSTFL